VFLVLQVPTVGDDVDSSDVGCSGVVIGNGVGHSHGIIVGCGSDSHNSGGGGVVDSGDFCNFLIV